MAIINVDDAYILNETGAQVDKVTGLFTKNENATTGEKQMARLNIAAGGTNPNLLDNWYFVGGGSQLGDGVFPINQRGQASYAGGATTTLDRWWQQYDAAVTLISAGLRLTGKWNISQRLPSVLPNGTYTFSVNVVTLNSAGVTISFIDQSDQIVAGATKVIDSTGITSLTITSDQIKGVEINLTNPSGTGDITIASAKLEAGTVSTLANDPPPDFETELMKCKAYFQRVKQPQGYTAPIGFGIIGASSNILRTLIPLSSPLRDATSITASATNIGQMKVWGNGSYFTPSAITGRTVLNGHAVVDITVSGSLQNYMVYHIILPDASTYIDLSAEI